MGEFDFDELLKVNFLGAFFWFFSFMVLVFLVLLNMLLAIVMDTYNTVKSRAASSMTVWEQTAVMVRRQRENRNGERVDLGKVLEIVEDEEFGDEDMIITPELLMAKVPRLPKKQANRVLDRVKDYIRHKSPSAVNIPAPSFHDAINLTLEFSFKMDKLVKARLLHMQAIRHLFRWKLPPMWRTTSMAPRTISRSKRITMPPRTAATRRSPPAPTWQRSLGSSSSKHLANG